MPLTRREAIAGGGGAVLLTAFPALAQAAYPSRTIKMIVPYPAGGTTDLLGRLVADQLKSGLNAGERIVTDGQLRLFPGAKVDIKGAKPS